MTRRQGRSTRTDGVELGDYIGVLGKTIFLGDHLGLGCVKKVCMSLCGVNEQKHT